MAKVRTLSKSSALIFAVGARGERRGFFREQGACQKRDKIDTWLFRAKKLETVESGGLQNVESGDKSLKRLGGRYERHRGTYYATKAAKAVTAGKAAKKTKAAKVHFESWSRQPSWCMSKEREGEAKKPGPARFEQGNNQKAS